ncbi:MAG TPA: hypothetical protein VNO69_00080 [Methyloceanibacter sp.]|nr:hypothetical protein [Methyloceanibacter sp.]
MAQESGNPWKTAAIVSAALLAVALLCFALVVAGVMNLGLSLL